MTAKITKKKRPAPKIGRVALTPSRKVYPESRVTRIAEMDAGLSESSSVRLSFDGTIDKAMVSAHVDALRNTMSKAADVAHKRSGNIYTVETGQFFTTKGDIVVTAVVTRTK